MDNNKMDATLYILCSAANEGIMNRIFKNEYLIVNAL